MKIKILSIIAAVFFVGTVFMGTYVLADDQDQGDAPPDSVLDDLQPLPGQNSKPTGQADKYVTEKTPDGDIKKPPALGEGGEPVMYTDESGDYYWGTNGLLYPWPPPMTVLEAAESELVGLEMDEADLLDDYDGVAGRLKLTVAAAVDAVAAKDPQLQAKIAKEIERLKKRLKAIKEKLEKKREQIKAAKAKKQRLEEDASKKDDTAFRDALNRADSAYNKPKKGYSDIYPTGHTVYTAPSTPSGMNNPAPRLPKVKSKKKEATSQGAAGAACN
jgi:hypothetical protein